VSLTAAEVLSLVEITRRARADVQAKASAADADMGARLREKVVLWDENKTAVDVTLRGKVNLEAQNLLDAIRVEVCDLLEWSVPEPPGRPQLPCTVLVGTCVRY
jgi:hypothetical protein